MQGAQRFTARRVLDAITVAGFLAAIGAPAVDQVLRSDAERGPARELRVPAPRPEWRWSAEDMYRFPDRYEAYFRDSFGLRDQLLRGHSIVKLFVFGVSPTPTVVLGDDGWMYFAGDRTIPVHRGLAPFTDAELEAWRRMLELHRDYLADAGIAHLYVIAPNKESVYFDSVPERFNRVGPSRLDQLTAYLREHSTIEILDLRAALSAVRRAGPIEEYPYFPLGTHWNGRGAYVAYAEILRALQPTFPVLVPIELAALWRIDVPGSGDSWAKSMYIEDLLPQTEIRYLPNPPRATIVEETPWGFTRKHVTEVKDPALPRAVFLHDSFGPYVEQLLSEHFERLTCAWRSHFDTALIDAERPDVVIEMYVERALVTQTPSYAIPRNQTAQARTFNALGDIRFVLDVRRDRPQLESVGALRCVRVEQDGERALELSIKHPTDRALLPAFALPKDRGVMIYVEIDSPAATVLDFFYMLDGDHGFQHGRRAEVELAHGRNQVFVTLSQPGLAGRLAFCPGRLMTSYVVRALEVRAVQVP